LDYLQFVAPYVESLNLKTERAKSDYAKHLRSSIDFITGAGLDVNNEDTFSALSDWLLQSFAPSTAQHRVNLTRRFFAWITTHEGGDFMSNIPLETEQQGDIQRTEDNPLEGASQEHEEKRKQGRPIKGNEGRDKKITVNIPRSVWIAIQDISRIDGVTLPDTVNAFLEEAVNARYEDIEALRQIRAKRH